MKFTDSELEILRILFDLGPATTRDVFDVVAKERRTTQATINTVVSNMCKKGMLDIVEDRRPAKYAPKKSIRPAYDAQLKQVAKRLFGSKRNFVLGILFGKQSAAEREQARKMLDELK